MCDYCNKNKELLSINYCGSIKSRIVDNIFEVYNNEHNIKFLKQFYGFRFNINYCPMCGRRLGETSD